MAAHNPALISTDRNELPVEVGFFKKPMPVEQKEGICFYSRLSSFPPVCYELFKMTPDLRNSILGS